MKVTGKSTWRRERNRQIFVEPLKKQRNIGGDVKETDKSTWRSESNTQIFAETWKNRQILVETLKKQTNIGGDVKERDFKETDKYWWRH